MPPVKMNIGLPKKRTVSEGHFADTDDVTHVNHQHHPTAAPFDWKQPALPAIPAVSTTTISATTTTATAKVSFGSPSKQSSPSDTSRSPAGKTLHANNTHTKQDLSTYLQYLLKQKDTKEFVYIRPKVERGDPRYSPYDMDIVEYTAIDKNDYSTLSKTVRHRGQGSDFSHLSIYLMCSYVYDV